MNLDLDSFRVWKSNAQKNKELEKVKKGGKYCIQDPEKGNQLLYSQAYLELLKEIRKGIATRNRSGSRSSRAALSLNVEINDENEAFFLLGKFNESKKEIEQHLKEYLHNMVRPMLHQLQREADIDILRKHILLNAMGKSKKQG